MSLFRYLIILSFVTVASWSAWVCVLVFMNPSGGIMSKLLFYITLALAFMSTFHLGGVLFRYLWSRDTVANKHVKIASRQSILFTLLFLATLVLQSFRYLAWWNLLLLVVLFLLVELFFISYKKFNKQ